MKHYLIKNLALTILVFFCPLYLISCGDDDNEGTDIFDTTKEYISPLKGITVEDVVFEANKSSKIVSFGQVDLSTCSVQSITSWCTATIIGKTIEVEVQNNSNNEERRTTIYVTDERDKTRVSFNVIQKQNNTGNSYSGGSNNTGNQEKYYNVKYEMNVDFGNSNHEYFLKMIFTTENGNKTITQRIDGRSTYSWEGTYGPFKKGDTVSFDCNSDIGVYPKNMYSGVGEYYGRIYVKEENNDFTIKSEGTGTYPRTPGLVYSSGLHLSYTIK